MTIYNPFSQHSACRDRSATYLLILFIPVWDIGHTVISPHFTILRNYLRFSHSQTHNGQVDYNISPPCCLGTTHSCFSCGCPFHCYSWYVKVWHSQDMAQPLILCFLIWQHIGVEFSFCTDLHLIYCLIRIYCKPSVDILFEIHPSC